MKEHYDRLGIPVTSTLDDVKRAYKRRAKELHPDVNKSPNAHAQFVDLQVSYEYLINVYTGKIYNQQRQRYETPKTRTMTKEEWIRNHQAQARQRAENYARMHFENFEKSAEYRVGEYSKDFFYLTYALLLIFFGIVCPLWMWVENGSGAGITLFIVINLFMIGPYARFQIDFSEHLKRKRFLQSYKERFRRK